MIGYDTGGPGGGGWAPDPDAARASWDRATGWLRDRVDEALEPIWEVVERAVETAIWVLERVEAVEAVHLDRWETASDERVCPECGPLHGRVLEPGEGPVPPLHVNCRCQRVRAVTEWRTRQVEAWRLRWTTRAAWEWQITGWQ